MREWKLISEGKPVELGFRTIIPRKYELPNGRRGVWHIKDEGQGSAVVALTALREGVLVRQFGPRAGRVLLELPGGNMDGAEDPIEPARRELREETGYDGAI